MRRKSKVERYSGFTIRKREYASKAVAWQLDVPMGERGKRKRTTYDTLEAAKAAAEEKAAATRSIGNQAFALTDRQRTDAVEAVGILAGAANLADAARFWVKHNRQADTGQTFGALVETYLADMVRRELRHHTINGATKRLTRMKIDMGQLPAARIMPADLENWLDAQSAKGQNRRNYIATVRAFYNWAVKNNVVESNPAGKDSAGNQKLTRTKMKQDLPAIFQPGTVAKILHGAEKVAPDCVAFLALCFFAGLRPMNEAGRVTWEAVDLDNGTIKVIPEVAKTSRARLVTIAPNLRDWLQRYRLANKGAQLAPEYWKIKRRMVEIKKAAGLTTWPPDVARHCYASAHLALHGDINKTCLELGHATPKMLFTHYRNLMSAKQAADFFDIRPKGAAVAVNAGAEKAAAS